MNTQATTLPPPLPTFDAAHFRLVLAGLVDPDYAGEDSAAAAQHREWAVDWCVCLCDLFGDSIDRVTLWTKIAAALSAACAKCDDGDVERFVDLCLRTVQADAGLAAASPDLDRLLLTASAKPISWRQGLVRYIESRTFAITAHARRQWGTVKAGRRDARALSEGGTLSTGEVIERGAR